MAYVLAVCAVMAYVVMASVVMAYVLAASVVMAYVLAAEYVVMDGGGSRGGGGDSVVRDETGWAGQCAGRGGLKTARGHRRLGLLQVVTVATSVDSIQLHSFY